ncbi:hypothetical protein V565_151220, partial [Rhizoctonia solani 123E]
MVELVESMAAGKPPSNATMKIPSLDDFQPADSDIAINTLWFCSLTLSMTVALVSMLVKQWGEGYLYGRHFTIVPYYVQARTRQARYNQLGRWKVRYVMRALHMMMHAALVRITSVLFNRVLPPSEHLRALPTSGEAWSKKPAAHEMAEWEISTRVTPDNLTAQAIIWLVSCARDSSSVDMGIRAIAGARAGPEFWDHLIQTDLVVLVAQRFTLFFKGTLEQSSKMIPNSNDAGLMQVALCSQALAKIARHSRVPIIPPPCSQSDVTPGLEVMILPEDQLSAVQYGLL